MSAEKPHGYLAAAYVPLVKIAQERGRLMGYAIAVHGSMHRDLDLVAIPWTDEARPAEELFSEIWDLFSPYGYSGDRNRTGEVWDRYSVPNQKPHGRLAWTIPLIFGNGVDLSVMPRFPVMKLIDLDPAWIELDGRRIGFVFVSPAPPCVRADGTINPGPPWRQTCFAEPTPFHTQRAIFERMFGAPHQVQGCNPDCAWTVAGGIDQATFETMTVTPSLDGSAGGLWHGFIKNGEAQ